MEFGPKEIHPLNANVFEFEWSEDGMTPIDSLDDGEESASVGTPPIVSE